MTDWTKLVQDADRCSTYRSLYTSQIHADKIAKFSIDEDKRDLLEDNGIDTYEKYCINKEEVEQAEETARKLVTEHLKVCKEAGCIALLNARKEAGQIE